MVKKIFNFRNADYEYVRYELFSSRAVNDNWHKTSALSLLFFERKKKRTGGYYYLEVELVHRIYFKR